MIFDYDISLEERLSKLLDMEPKTQDIQDEIDAIRRELDQ